MGRHVKAEIKQLDSTFGGRNQKGIGQMNSIYFQSGYKYQLYYNCLGSLGRKVPKPVLFDWFSISENGNYVIKKGYAWDGPSGPTIDTKNFMRGSLVHDVLYQAIRLDLLPTEYRKEADETLKEICLQDGMSRVRAAWVFWGVRIGGGPAIRNERKVHRAP